MGCTRGIHPDELAHGLSLLRDVTSVWLARYASVPIDHVCSWPVLRAGSDRPVKCSDRIDRVTFLRTNDRIDVAAYCDHHADCMDAAYEQLKADHMLAAEGTD